MSMSCTHTSDWFRLTTRGYTTSSPPNERIASTNLHNTPAKSANLRGPLYLQHHYEAHHPPGSPDCSRYCPTTRSRSNLRSVPGLSKPHNQTKHVQRVRRYKVLRNASQ